MLILVGWGGRQKDAAGPTNHTHYTSSNTAINVHPVGHIGATLSRKFV